MSQVKTNNTTGHIKRARIVLSKPTPMNIEDLNLQKLNLMVGTNGSGKTFCLVTMWLFGYLSSCVIIMRRIPNPAGLEQFAQHAVDHCYDSKDITGNMSVVFDSGAEISITLNEGKVENISHTGFEDIEHFVPFRFMSSAMRTFEAMNMYLKLRGMLEKMGHKGEQLTNEMLKTFKLYDVIQLEHMIMSMPYKVSKELQESMKNFDIGEGFREFGVDLEKGNFYVILDPDGKQKDLATFSKGEQALINMTLSNLL